MLLSPNTCLQASNTVFTSSGLSTIVFGFDSMPISGSTFGANITYNPSFEKFVSMSDGTFNEFTLTFRDQNLNEVYAKDPNVSITLIIRPKK